MIARIRVVELTSNTPAPSFTSITPMPTPVIAVAIGIAEATTEPSVTSSTISATTRPSASTTLRVGRWVENTSPPTRTREPGRVSCRVWAVAVSSSRCASVKVEIVPSTRMVARPLPPSALISPSMTSSPSTTSL